MKLDWLFKEQEPMLLQDLTRYQPEYLNSKNLYGQYAQFSIPHVASEAKHFKEFQLNGQPQRL
jgi:hypothetical protein